MRVLAAALLATLLGVLPAGSQSFARGPLDAPVAYPTYGLPSDWPELRQWLADSAAVLDHSRLVEAREQLYAIISARVRQRVAQGLPALPRGNDSELAELFSWGDRLGVVGAGLVAARLLGWPADFQIQTAPAEGFRIRFDSTYTIIDEHDGWRIDAPYYFMIGLLRRDTLSNDIPASMVILSTLFADDSTTNPGASQATIVAISSPVAPPQLAAFGLRQFGLSPADSSARPVPTASLAYAGREPSGRINVELAVFAAGRQRAMLFAYAGLPGTYDANRAHYIDLLNTIRIRGPMTPEAE